MNEKMVVCFPGSQESAGMPHWTMPPFLLQALLCTHKNNGHSV